MSKKISDLFKLEPNFSSDSDLNQENPGTSAEVKNEKEGNFDINLDEVEPQIKKDSSNQTEVRKCSVILHDINKEIQNGNLTINKSEPENKLKSGQNEVTENYIKNIPKAHKKPLKSSQSECSFCGKKLTQFYLLDHMNRVHPEQLKQQQNGCKICNRKFFSFKSLKKHMDMMHAIDFYVKSEDFECDFDGKLFKTKNQLLSHMKMHLSKIKCEICGVEIKSNSMKNHKKEVHADDGKCECQICQKCFKTELMLKYHIKIHNKAIKCSMCSKLFSTQGQLKSHVKSEHENPGSFKCETCDKKFNQKNNMKKHEKIHDKNRPKPFKCQRCDFATDSKQNYKNHSKVHERQEKFFAAMKNPLKCEKCPTFCRNKKALYTHMRRVHPKVPFQCDLCGKYMKKKPTVRMHILAHLMKQKYRI